MFSDELHVQNLQDGWSILYVNLARNLTENHGIEGETARLLRCGVRWTQKSWAVFIAKSFEPQQFGVSLQLLLVLGRISRGIRGRRWTAF